MNQTREVSPLLEEIPKAATRLLEADRASIFLWDRRTKTLVGRPALGVRGGELRVPDDRGVVGQVVQKGIRCVSIQQPSGADQSSGGWSLGYKTRTILCDPASNGRGDQAFELINKTDGTFDAEDEEFWLNWRDMPS
jgi:Nif-specific regulatory protein